MSFKKTIICSMGGGFSSTALMPRILLEQYPKEQLHFVNCVLPNEFEDTWPFFDKVSETLGIEIHHIAYVPLSNWKFVSPESRSNSNCLLDPFDIFDQEHFIGNSRIDPCSKLLKRKTILRYVKDVFEKDEVIIAVGIHEDEVERSLNIQKNWLSQGYEVVFPLLGQPSHDREAQKRLLQEWYGVKLTAYELGFEHNNCAGACVKAGQRQWGLLWFHRPETYSYWESREAQWRSVNGEHTILTMVRKGTKTPITLQKFREEHLEPAFTENKSGFLGRYLRSLPGNPPCSWCAAI